MINYLLMAGIFDRFKASMLSRRKFRNLNDLGKTRRDATMFPPEISLTAKIKLLKQSA